MLLETVLSVCLCLSVEAACHHLLCCLLLLLAVVVAAVAAADFDVAVGAAVHVAIAVAVESKL